MCDPGQVFLQGKSDVVSKCSKLGLVSNYAKYIPTQFVWDINLGFHLVKVKIRPFFIDNQVQIFNFKEINGMKISDPDPSPDSSPRRRGEKIVSITHCGILPYFPWLTDKTRGAGLYASRHHNRLCI